MNPNDEFEEIPVKIKIELNARLKHWEVARIEERLKSILFDETWYDTIEISVKEI